jgi:hypothetical protein
MRTFTREEWSIERERVSDLQIIRDMNDKCIQEGRDRVAGLDEEERRVLRQRAADERVAELRAKPEVEMELFRRKVREEEEIGLQAKAAREAKEQEEKDRLRDKARRTIDEERTRWQKEFPGRGFTEEEGREVYRENGRTYMGEIAFLLKRARNRTAREQEELRRR